MKAQKSGMTQEQWFRMCVLAPAQEAWGVGWHRLSNEQKIAEVQAKAWAVLTASGRIENATTDDKEAAALGRHVVYILRGFQKWTEDLEEIEDSPFKGEDDDT